MGLRTRRLLINATSLLLLLGAVATVAYTQLVSVDTKIDDSLTVGKAAPRGTAGSGIDAQLAQLSPRNPAWQRVLRRPLYDPPPPPKRKIVKKVRPIRIKLTGTVLEPNNSQAFVKQANGTVELKRIGDLVTNDPLDGTIQRITATEIVIKREDGEHHIKVEGQ